MSDADSKADLHFRSLLHFTNIQQQQILLEEPPPLLSLSSSAPHYHYHPVPLVSLPLNQQPRSPSRGRERATMSSQIPAHLITQWSKLPPSKIPAAVAKTGLRISRKKAAISARLERLRTGPGSKKLPNDVTGLKLEFAFRNTHMGAR